jgi:hypothetical protein
MTTIEMMKQIDDQLDADWGKDRPALPNNAEVRGA